MTRQRLSACVAVVCLLGAVSLRAQSSLGGDANNGAGVSVVPRVIKFSGEINPQATQVTPTKESESAKNLFPTVVGVTFSLYELQEGGSPLWSESQKVQVNEQGHYTVLLGATQPEGLPLDLFASGKALWLGTQPQLSGAVEQPRAVLVAVPYALKAADSDTLGGKPASAFVTVGSLAPALSGTGSEAAATGKSNAGTATPPVQGTGGPAPSVGCSVTSDGSGIASSLAKFVSPCKIQKSAIFEAGGNVQVTGNLFSIGNVTTRGFLSASRGSFFGPVMVGSGNVSVSNGDLDLPNTTAATAGVINLGGSAFLHQCCNTSSGYTNTFVGRDAGNFSTTGGYNTASGYGALFLNATGTDNTANGYVALDLNSTGNYNTATGDHALYSNETGSNNTASGAGALYVNVGGSGNTAVGFNAGTDLHRSFPTSGSNSTFVGANATATMDNLTNATAIGYNAQVGESNALVLGSGAMVGIGTSTPQYALDVHGTGNFTGAVTVTGLTPGKCVQAGTGGLLATTASPCGSGGGGGGGTVTSVGSGAGLTGGPITGSGTLSIAIGGVTDAMMNNPYAGTGACGAGAFVTSLNRAAGPTCTFGDGRYAQLAAPNTFAATQTIGSGDLSVSNGDLDLPATTGATVGVINLGGIPFMFGISTNTFVGLGAGNFSSTLFGGNTATGYHALSSNTTGFYNTASGYGAMFSNTTGANNTASGLQALYWNTTGNNNTASGDSALYSNTAGYANTASGVNALSSNTAGYSNTASGVAALYGNTMGYQNTATGLEALYWNTTGNNNTASGYWALYSNTTGNNNTASGLQALYSNATGYYNTASGTYALASNTTGSGNTAIGYNTAGNLSTGSNNTFVGVNSGALVDGLTNATAIGACANASASNALVLGARATSCNAVASGNTNVGIDVGNPSNIFTVLQGGGHAIADGWDTYSSGRWKSDIQPLHGALGKVELLRGVSYTYTANGKHDIGMIAEEVGKVVPEVVSYEENGKDARGIDYARLTALLVEALKQQQSEIRRLEAKVRQLEASKANAVQPVTKPAKTAAAKAGK